MKYIAESVRDALVVFISLLFLLLMTPPGWVILLILAAYLSK